VNFFEIFKLFTVEKAALDVFPREKGNFSLPQRGFRQEVRLLFFKSRKAIQFILSEQYL